MEGAVVTKSLMTGRLIPDHELMVEATFPPIGVRGMGWVCREPWAWVGWLMLWLGAATPHDGMGHASEHVST